MDEKSVFNVAVCIIGIAIFSIHIFDLVLKKGKRRDENSLLAFIFFTAFHFALYLVFTFIKTKYKSNNLIISFYTIFYLFNNIQLLFLFLYSLNYIEIPKKNKKKLIASNLVVFYIYILLIILNIFYRFYFTAEKGKYVRSGAMLISQGYQFFTFLTVFLLAIFNKKLTKSEKIAFSIYCAIPFTAIILQNVLPGYAVAYLSIIIAIEILFLFVNVRKNILLANEAKRNKEVEVKIMMSQIQPHFIYNTLASISTLIEVDADKAQKALDDFTEYLRVNLSSLSDDNLIPFVDELEHVKTYLSLEKMRFEDRLNIIYEIDNSDFLVPPLSVQPIVENAVKHGILQNVEGGTIKIKAYQEDNYHVVEIIDNGVGFDTSHLYEKDKMHVGINNVRSRLINMSNGGLEINSEINIGTTVKMMFRK